MEYPSTVVTDLRPAIIDLIRSLELGTPAPEMRDTDTSRELQTLTLALASSQCGVAFCYQSGRILLANQRLNAIFGYEESELLNRDLTELIPDAVVASAPLAARRNAALGGVSEADPTQTLGEVDGIRRDGSVVPVR